MFRQMIKGLSNRLATSAYGFRATTNSALSTTQAITRSLNTLSSQSAKLPDLLSASDAKRPVVTQQLSEQKSDIEKKLKELAKNQEALAAHVAQIKQEGATISSLLAQGLEIMKQEEKKKEREDKSENNNSSTWKDPKFLMPTALGLTTFFANEKYKQNQLDKEYKKIEAERKKSENDLIKMGNCLLEQIKNRYRLLHSFESSHKEVKKDIHIRQKEIDQVKQTWLLFNLGRESSIKTKNDILIHKKQIKSNLREKIIDTKTNIEDLCTEFFHSIKEPTVEQAHILREIKSHLNGTEKPVKEGPRNKPSN